MVSTKKKIKENVKEIVKKLKRLPENIHYTLPTQFQENKIHP